MDIIFSMANRRKRQTGLPVNIWIDENATYRKAGHSKRIKFQLNYGNLMIDQPNASMTLDGNVVENTYNPQVSEISKRDIQQVSNFVKNNSYALSRVADGELFLDDFDDIMIKGSEPADIIDIENQKEIVDQIIKLNKENTF